MEIIQGPSVVTKAEHITAGIRTVTQFRGMFAVRDKLMQELFERLDSWGLDFGPTFFRLHVVDMEGNMDVEVGTVTARPVSGDDRVRPGVLPAGRYAALTYVNHGRRANGTLVDWVRAKGLDFDCEAGEGGDQFACRYEMYLTDPRTERMKTRWQIELAIRLADN